MSPSTGVVFALLAGTVLGACAAAATPRSAAVVARATAGRARATVAGLAALWGAVVLYAHVYGAGASVPIVALVYAAYLALPATCWLAASSGASLGASPGASPGASLADAARGASHEATPLPARAAWGGLGAATLLWLPFELRLLPTLPLAPRVDGSKLLAVLAGLWLFARVRPVPGMGLALLPRRHDLPLAVGAFAAFAAVALPVGLATGFLTWHPRPGVDTLVVRPLLIYLAIALPEEFLFRGLFQRLLATALGPRAGLALASVVFGLAHLPDPRYVALATVAGVAYGIVWQRTGRVAAAAVTHALVDAAWVLLLRR